MNICLSMLILISSIWIQIATDNIKTQIILNGSSDKFHDTESQHIFDVCNRYKNESCGVGLVSLNQKKKCIPWNNTIWRNEVLLNKTTICRNFLSKYSWCAIDYDLWDHCPPIKCKYIDPDENICHDQIYWSSTKSSISIDFSRAIAPIKHEILIILLSLDNRSQTVECFITKICRVQCSLIDRFYKDSCKSLPNTIINGSKVVTFPHLTQDTNHMLYMVPVIDDDTIGSAMTTLSMKTALPVPHAPSNITISDKSSTSIKLGWSPSTRSADYGPPEGYQVTMNGGDRILNTTTNDIDFDNLHQCRLHCFVVASFNKAGRSADSVRICTNTTMEFEKVELSPMEADFSLSRRVTWRYSDVNTCSVIFKIRYAVLNDEEKAFAFTTSAYSIQLNGLETDQIYSIKVRPSFDGKSGEYSSTKEFHTFRVPDIPSVLTIYEKMASCIKLTWKLSERSDEYGPAQGYQVTGTSDNFYKTWRTSSNNIEVNSLKECTHYCFVVASFNTAGKSADSQRICAPTETNFKRVDLLQVVSKTASWQYNNDSQCPVTFEVHYSIKNDASSAIITTTDSRNIQLKRIDVDQIYRVTIQPKHNGKYGDFSSSIDFHTFRKPTTPGMIFIVKATQTSISLQWQKSRITETFGSPQKYSVIIYNSSTTSMHVTPMEFYDFNNLRTFSNYCFIVAAFNLAGASTPSRPVCGNTSAGHITRFDVRVVKTTPTSISLHWRSFDYTKEIEPDRKYTITIYNTTTLAVYNTSMESHDFNNLRHCSYYCFTVTASYLVGTFNDSSSLCGYTSADFDQVTWLPARSRFFTSNIIKWTYNNTFKCNIVFHIQYFMKNQQNQLLSKNTSDTQIRLDNLSTNDIYVVRVQPMFGDWRGQFSTNRVLYTNTAIPIMKQIQMYSNKNDISILWDIDLRKSMPSNMFMLKLSNVADECLYLVTLICSSCQYEIDESIINETQKEYLSKINKCPVTKNETLYEDQVQFVNTIPTNGSEISGTLVIYSVNVLGIHELGIQNFYLDFKSRENGFVQKEKEIINWKFLSNVKGHLRKFESLIADYIDKLNVLSTEVNNLKIEVINKDRT